MKRITFLFIVPAFFLASCASLQPVEVTGLESLRIEKLSRDGIDAEVMLKIKNPNKVKFTIVDYDLDISIMNIKIGKAKLKEKVKVEGNAEKAYPFQVNAKFGKMLIAAIPVFMALSTKQSTDVGAKGYVKVRAWGISKKVDVDLKDHINLLK